MIVVEFNKATFSWKLRICKHQNFSKAKPISEQCVLSLTGGLVLSWLSWHSRLLVWETCCCYTKWNVEKPQNFHMP